MRDLTQFPSQKGVINMKFNSVKKVLKHPTPSPEDGLGLIEVIAALGIAVVVVTSLVSLSVFTLRSSNKGKLFLRASKLANQELELVRAYRDSQPWETFVDSAVLATGTGCANGNQCHMTINSSQALVISAGSFTEDPGGLNEITYYFTVTDPISEAGEVNPGAVDSNDPVLRIEVTAMWDFNGENSESTHIYTDVSNWRSSP